MPLNALSKENSTAQTLVTPLGSLTKMQPWGVHPALRKDQGWGQAVRIRKIPDLTFEVDDTLDKAERIEQILNKE